MSRVGKRIIALQAGTTIKVEQHVVTITGPLGTITRQFSPLIAITVRGNQVATTRKNDAKHTKQLHGTTNALLASMAQGVVTGFKKALEIKGVGYRAVLRGEQIEINAGYSHPVCLDVLPGVQVVIPKPTEIVVAGIDKQVVGQMAALIRDVRRPNPYSGKGIMHAGEHIRRKEGKAVAKQ